MARKLILFLAMIMCASIIIAQNPDSAKRYMDEAEYYHRQAVRHQNDAEYYLRQAKSAEGDAEYYLRNKKYDRARDCFRRASTAMDNYQAKLNSARNSASKAEDYLKKAADALR